jgi:geranylgeranyl diphosphate synthase type I
MTAAEVPAPAVDRLTLIDRVDDTLATFLDAHVQNVERRDPRAALLIEEVRRLVRAGGRRVRPAFCFWGYRAAGGVDGEPIVRAAAAIELLHTMALVHDDLIDGTPERRGVPTTKTWLTQGARDLDLGRGDPAAFGGSGAILVGDLAAVLADRLMLESGFPASVLVRALAPYHEMRTDMAVGQFLDLAVVPVDPSAARRIAALKGGSYTAGATPLVTARLRRFGAPLGEAFQLRDDLMDGDAAHGATAGDVDALVQEAVAALDPEVLDADAVEALRALADLIRVR